MDGKELQKRRLAKGYTQAELAGLIDHKTWSIAAYENDRVEPPVVVRYRLAKVLEWPELVEDLTSGEKIRIARAEKDMTQEALAAALGVHRVTVNAWEMDKNPPSAGKQRKIADALGCRLSELF